jgi:hypothetical protein
MNFKGILLLDLISVIYILWNISLVRQGRLYVGYSVIFIVLILLTMITITITPVLEFVTRLVGALFPASALTLLALAFIVLLLIYILTQTTILSNRIAALVQELAIRQAGEQAPKNADGLAKTISPKKKK